MARTRNGELLLLFLHTLQPFWARTKQTTRNFWRSSQCTVCLRQRIELRLATPVVSYKLVLVFNSTILETTGVCRYDHIQYFFDWIELVVNMQATLSKHNSRKSRSFPVLDSGNENHVQCLKENNTLCKPDNGWYFLLLFGMCWSRLSGHAQNSRSVWRRRKIYPSRSCMLPKQNKNSTAVVLWYTFCAQDTHIF